MKRAEWTEPKVELIGPLAKLRRPGENLVDVARRELVNGALAWTGGVQSEAAELLHVTPRQMQLWTKDLRIRPSDRKMAS